MSFGASSDSFSQRSDALSADLSYPLDSSTFDFEPSDALRETRMIFSSRGVGHLLKPRNRVRRIAGRIHVFKTPINTSLFGVHGHVRPKQS